MNCKSYQTEIEELFGATELSAETARHLNDCLGCKKFKTERERLAALIVCLERVDAPENFEFGVRAKLNRPQPKRKSGFGWNKLLYASPVAAAILLGMVLTNNYIVSVMQPEPQVTATAPTQTPTETAVIKPASTPELTGQNEPTAPSLTEPTSPIAFNSPSANAAPKNARVAPRKNVKNTPREEILVRDSRTLALREGKIRLNPNGIPLNQPTASPLSSAKNLLTFHGIETTEESGILRVTSVKTKTPAEAAGIKTGDLIESINGQQPTNFNASSLDSVKIRRESATQEIKLSPMP